VAVSSRCWSCLAVAAWFASGLYIVRANEVALNLLFGKFTGRSQEGLNYNWPPRSGRSSKWR